MSRRLTCLLVVAAVIAVFASAGCGGNGGTTATEPTTPVTAPSTQPDSGATLQLFFVKDDIVTQVSRKGVKGGAAEALNALLGGPNASEQGLGMGTAIPAGTKLLSYTVVDRTAKADFSKELLDYGGGSARVQAIMSQIENTIMQNDSGVGKIEILVAGTPADEALQP